MNPERIAQLRQMAERGTICKGHITEMLDAIEKALAQPAQGPAIPSTQDAASKVGPFWQEFSVVYEAISKQQITIREIAWRCFLAAKITTQPAQEPVAWLSKGGKGIWFHEPDASLNATPLYAAPPQRPWVGLTEKEKKEIYRLSVYVEGAISLTEAILKEKNNG